MNNTLIYVSVVSGTIGFFTGIVLHRSDFCFASMFRDYFLFRNAFMLRILVLLVLTGILLIELGRQAGLLPLYPFSLLHPPSLTNIIGGLVFGTGMVMAGGCVVSTVYKMGTGSVLSYVAFAGLLAGSGLYAELHPWWKKVSSEMVFGHGNVTIPQFLNIDPVFIVCAAAIITMFFLCRWFANGEMSRPAHAEGYLQPWKAAILLSLAGFVSCLLIGLPLGITTSYAKLAAFIETAFLPEHVQNLQFFTLIPFKLTIPLLNRSIEGGPGPVFDGIWAKEFWLFAGILAGSACSAIMLKEFSFRFQVPVSHYVLAFSGGCIMALGSRFAPACNVLHVIGGIPVFAVSSFLFLGGLVAGAWIGSKIVERTIIRSM